MGCSPTQNGEVKIIMNNIAKASQTTDKDSIKLSLDADFQQFLKKIMIHFYFTQY